MSRKDDIATLTDMVERMGAAEVINLVSEVCSDKADEAREENDEDLADTWDDMAGVLNDIEWEEE